ncbi:MAG: hypothetical protein ACFBSE_10075 [Prochloraceae cyanobacterium]
MSQSKLLKNLEYGLVAASAAGLVFALEGKQSSFWAIAPLTGTMVVNVLNRRNEDKTSIKAALDEIADIEQRMLNKIQWLEDTVKALPPAIEPNRIEKLEEITTLNRGTLLELEKRFLETILPELKENINVSKNNLEKNKKAIEQIEEKLKKIPTRTDLELQTKDTLSILETKQKVNDEDIAALTDKINSVSWRIEEIYKSDRKVDKLREEFERFLKQREIESLTSELDSPLGAYSFTSVAKQIDSLKEQTTDSQSAILQLQKVLKDFPTQEEIETIKNQLQAIKKQADPIDFNSESDSLEEIQAKIAELKTELDRQKLNKQLAEENGENNERANKNIFSWLSNRF